MKRPVFRASMALLTLLALLPAHAAADPCSVDPDNDGSRYAFGENVGWIDLAPATGQGVTVSPSALTGHAWGENIGWITFSPATGGVVNDGTGALSGFAWGENTGWINFAPAGGGVGIDPVTGIFGGRAWGENIGWISFGSSGPEPFAVKCSPACVTSPVDGVCGSAVGSVSPIPPTTGLCAAGSPSAVSGSANWSWSCAGLFGGNDASCTADMRTWPLTVGREGAGAVSSTFPDSSINCTSTCTKSYPVNSVVTLTAAAVAGSHFTQWTGCTAVNGTQCSVTMDRARIITAGFAKDTDVKVATTFHDSIAAGYSALAAGDVLQLRSVDFSTDLNLNRSLTFVLRGGHDATFSSVAGMSTIRGSLTISAGTAIIENVVIADDPSPIAGNNGVITASELNPAGGTLNLTSSGTRSTNTDDLLYSVYVSDTNNLATVADVERNGTILGNVTVSDISRVGGKVNNALEFGSGRFVDAGNAPGINFGTGSFSVEAWVNSSAWGDCAGILGKGASEPGETGYVLRQVLSGTTRYFQFVIGNGLQQASTAKSGYVENAWYHLVGVADRTNNVIKLYVNGSLAASASLAGYAGSTDSAVNLTIGKQNIRPINQDRYFSGIIDEVALYSRVLSDAEIVGRYNAGAGKSVEAVSGLAAGWRFDEVGGALAADLSGAGNTGRLQFPMTIDVAGLAPATRYYLNVIATDTYGNKAAYAPVQIATSVTPIAFSGTIVPYNMYMPTVGDLNNDGFIEALGTLNDGNGNLTTKSAASMGLGKLFAPGRVQRDCRIADFNGDRLPDLICNTYSAAEEYTTPDPLCQSWKTSYSPNSVALLFFNNGDGTFREDPNFTAQQIMGFGETILTADFNNDGHLDIYLPFYSSCSPTEHSWLLINDGSGKFTDIADTAGVSLRNRDVSLRVEGAQAVDFNQDGWIDFYVGGHLFINNGIQNGNLTFADQRAALGLPDVFDEGFKFTDWNNDGLLDLVIHHPTTGPALYQYNGTGFTRASVIPANAYQESYGLNMFDMNNDGREDIITSGGTLATNPTVVLLNNGSGFVRSNPTAVDAWGQDTISFGDTDNDGRLDILKRMASGGTYGLAHYKNLTTANGFFKIEVVGPSGEQNQQGRVVKVYPENHPGTVYTRIVDSGSGYMNQSPYEIIVGTPHQEPHAVAVYYYGKVVNFTINPGERKRVFPDGRTEDY